MCVFCLWIVVKGWTVRQLLLLRGPDESRSLCQWLTRQFVCVRLRLLCWWIRVTGKHQAPSAHYQRFVCACVCASDLMYSSYHLEDCECVHPATKCRSVRLYAFGCWCIPAAMWKAGPFSMRYRSLLSPKTVMNEHFPHIKTWVSHTLIYTTHTHKLTIQPPIQKRL